MFDDQIASSLQIHQKQTSIDSIFVLGSAEIPRHATPASKSPGSLTPQSDREGREARGGQTSQKDLGQERAGCRSE